MLKPLKFTFPKYLVLVLDDPFMLGLAPMRFSVIGTTERIGFLGKIFKRKTIKANLSNTVGNNIGYDMLGQRKHDSVYFIEPSIKTIVHDRA